jgi:mannose-6-phosphate isomerase-like protein (cupin superfamily)
MATTGDTLRQGDTDLMVFRKTSADTGGAYLEVEATYSAMPDVRPPVHSHPKQDENFQVLEGELSFLIEGEPRTLSEGEELFLPKGNKHTVWASGPDRTRFVWRTTPALRTEKMYETLWGLADEGKMGRHGKPRPPLLQSALLMLAYRNEYRLVSPPYPVFLPICAILAVPALALGYRPHYAR